MIPGRYYVGDLDPILGSEWNELNQLLANDSFINGRNVIDHIMESGREISLAFTKNGNGLYIDSNDKEYHVHNHHIGVINIMDIDLANIHNINQGHVVDVVNDFDLSYQNGSVIIDELVIDTGRDYDDYLVVKLCDTSDFYFSDSNSDIIHIIETDLDQGCFYGLDSENDDVIVYYEDIDLESALFYKMEPTW